MEQSKILITSLKDNLKIKWTTMKNQRRNPTMRVSGCLSQMAAQLLSPFISVPSLSLEEKGSLLPWSFLSLPYTNELSPFISFFWQPHPENKNSPFLFLFLFKIQTNPLPFLLGLFIGKNGVNPGSKRLAPISIRHAVEPIGLAWDAWLHGQQQQLRAADA